MSGYVYYAWLNYRNFGTHYRNFGTLFRNFGTSVKNVPAAYVERSQSSYNPSDCWKFDTHYRKFDTLGTDPTYAWVSNFL